jgi:hypothetical protein
MVADTPSTSTRLAGHVMHASHTAAWQVMHQQQLHPYRRQTFQAMGPEDYPMRQDFSQWFSNAVLQILGSPASCSTQMRRPLLERVLSTATKPCLGRRIPARNTQTRPPANIFHQCLVWCCSWPSNRPQHTYCTLDRICLQVLFWAFTARIAGECAATRSPKDVVHAWRGSSSFQHVLTRIPESGFSCAVDWARWSFFLACSLTQPKFPWHFRLGTSKMPRLQ